MTKIIFVLSIIGNLRASYYLHNTNKFINNGFTGTYTINTKYYVVASSNDKTESTKSFTKDTTIYYYKYSRSIDKAKETLGEYNYKDTDNLSLKLELRATILYSHLRNDDKLIKEELKSIPIQDN